MGAGGQRSGVEGEQARDGIDMDGGDAADDVMVLELVVPADPVLVVDADRGLDPPGGDRGVDASADARVGEHLAAVEVHGRDLLDLEIGMNAGSRLALYGGRPGEQGDACDCCDTKQATSCKPLEKSLFHWPYP